MFLHQWKFLWGPPPSFGYQQSLLVLDISFNMFDGFVGQMNVSAPTLMVFNISSNMLKFARGVDCNANFSKLEHLM